MVAHHRPVDLPDQRRFADAGRAREQQQLVAAGAGALEGGQQRLGGAPPAVERGRQDEVLAAVVLAEREILDVVVRLPLPAHDLEVGEQAGALVDTGRRSSPAAASPAARGCRGSPGLYRGRDRQAGDVRVHQLERVRAANGNTPVSSS